jgi:hypothetical protein
MKCLACNSEIEVITGQLRSADEARTFIYTCPKCPLDASRFTSAIEKPHIHVPRLQTVKKQIPLLRNSSYHTTYVLSMQIKQAKKDMKFEQILFYNATGEKLNTFKCHISGPFVGSAMREMSKTYIAPYTHLVSYNTTKCPKSRSTTHVLGEYSIQDSMIYTRTSQDLFINIILVDNSMDTICDNLRDIYLLGYQPISLNNIISTAKLGAMSNLTARAYDQSSADPLEYDFSTKPDGDRVWMTKVGVVWIRTGRLTGHSLKSWTIDNTIPKEYISTVGPCIDLELMHTGLSGNYYKYKSSGRPILIDVLMNENGKISDQQRNIPWIYAELDRLSNIFPCLQNVYKRQFRHSLQESIADRKICGYPTDGIVAIHKNGTDMLKIKTIKSAELKMEEDGSLSTEDGTKLFKINPVSTYSPGSIIEVKFSISNNALIIDSHFLRTDKTTANKLEVVHAILSSAVSKISPNLLRNELWRWSNNVRKHIYKTAGRMSQDKQIILDIGTGDGQGTDTLLADKSYVFIEPDENRCINLARRLRINKNEIKTEPRSIIPRIPRMKKGTLKYHILNITLQEFLADETVRDNISDLIGCCISSFSAQYVIDCMPILYSIKIPFIGSCYMYDGIEVGGSIINSSGLSMTRISQDKAVVVWGKDKEYYEPALESSDLPTNTSVLDSTTSVEYSSRDTNDPGYIATQHMKILIYN